MSEVILTNYDSENQKLSAVFDPERGMALLSMKKGELEVIDQTTTQEFDQKRSGLGPLIGPHFHTHTKYEIPSFIDESLFPHIAFMRKEGKKDVFSHGVARYAPWKYRSSETQIQGELCGSDKWQGVALADLEGQDFQMTFEARLLTNGLFIKYSVKSEKPSMIGLHYYYAIHRKSGKVYAQVEPQYNDQGTIKPLPKEWTDGRKGHLDYDLAQESDYGFIPIELQNEYKVRMETGTHALHIHFLTPSAEEKQFQIYSPKNADFVCIEPMTAKEPRNPNLKHSMLECKIEITDSQ